MNELNPNLKRLLKWAQAATPSKPEEAPFGFPGRVLAAQRPVQAPTLFQELQRTAWGITCASLALVMGGGLVLLNQRSSPPPEPEISSALNFVANNLLQ
jgi:hypothetical protein